MKHQLFNQEVAKRIHKGKWGLEEINYLQANKHKYHLGYEDIVYYLQELYRYTYALAMQDGVVTPQERVRLTNIKTHLQSAHKPQNRFELEQLKHRIEAAQIHYFRNHEDEYFNFSHRYASEDDLKEEVQNAHRIHNVPRPRYPRPKLTPYRNW